MYNRIIIFGKITKKEVRYSKDGVCFALFTLVTYKKYKETWQNEYFDCKIIGKSAENFNQWAQEKEYLLVDGEQQTDIQEIEGKKRYFKKVLVSNFKIMPKSKQVTDEQAQASFDTNFNQEVGGEDNTSTYYVNDDIPF